ncbi:hypothetical protein GF386_01470 [Candidatus Pacearchaeota archaeon]|nr:hypothetical protein [Candidatus Pacearchaeota archaeon]MBD3282852.1 hypothetical protein [Candidatus Pacearchaeota archaeon]
MVCFFRKKAEKKEVDELKRAVQTGFNSAKEDVGKLTQWIKHLNSQDNDVKEDILDIHDEIEAIKGELENIKNILSIVGDQPMFKQKQTVFNKQTVSKGVLNSVQTGVQTVFLENLSPTERAIVFILLNSDMKLSYDDISSMLGKSRSTIRGQINSIKQKSEGLIKEVITESNKKRIYIPEKSKEILLKNRKVRENNKKEEDD